ncbi:MAG: hypothetical protein D8M58_20060 [Calditrichaeota bacterium]|nr:MAG: hypothetical protein DWQ03_14805 [Calditrichota bacterium]MBL1207705.1 hypothetical protein [Calditrichota bacterium]NOG47540.1 hypothetical protein [Calditrichota bacterium]
MGKILKSASNIFIVLIILIITKNLILYSTYNHGAKGLKKTLGSNTNIFGTWELSVDSFDHLIDTNEKWKLVVNDDSTGHCFIKKSHSKIIVGDTQPYSWASLLPYEEKRCLSYNSRIILDNEYLIFLPDSNSMWIDTMYTKYLQKEDSLLIDRGIYHKKYTEPPIWGFYYSYKVPLSNMFEFWFF